MVPVAKTATRIWAEPIGGVIHGPPAASARMRPFSLARIGPTPPRGRSASGFGESRVLGRARRVRRAISPAAPRHRLRPSAIWRRGQPRTSKRPSGETRRFLEQAARRGSAGSVAAQLRECHVGDERVRPRRDRPEQICGTRAAGPGRTLRRTPEPKAREAPRGPPSPSHFGRQGSRGCPTTFAAR